MNSNKPDIILYGGPASGKSTQAKLLVSKLKAAHMNMGGLLRATIAQKGSYYTLVKEYISAGKLVPEKISSKLVCDFVDKVSREKRIVFDGYPRRMSQVKVVETIEQKHDRKTFFIFIDLPLNVAKDRICKRVELENRTDDADPKAVSHRIKLFQQKAKDILKHYKTKGTLIRIDGNQDITSVQKDILKAVKSL